MITPTSAIRTQVGIVSIKSVREGDFGVGPRTGHIRLITSFETCRARIGEAGLRWNGLRSSELDFLG